MNDPLLLLGAGLLAGAMNAAAGGGTFVSLPALIFAGVPSVGANTSSTVALFPGSVASTWAYRKNLGEFKLGVSIAALMMVSIMGSILGALLLLLTPSRSFDVIVPWLLLVGTVTFGFGRQIGDAFRRRIRVRPLTVLLCQFVLGIYGGYFGGAVGIMMMAVWGLLGAADIKAMNATKTLLVGATNSIAVICFVVAGKVWWPETCVVMVAAIVGGYGGARLAQRTKAEHLRAGINVVNVVMTALFFYRTFG